MSALESTSEWTEDNFTARPGENPFELFDRIDEAFRADFRIPLDQILKNDIDDFMLFLEDKIGRDTETKIKKRAIKRSEGFLSPIMASISNFLKGLFR